MNWNCEELACGREVAKRIAECSTSPSAPPLASAQLRLSLADASELVEGVHWSFNGLLSEGAVAVRHICRSLGFDEHLPLRWRLEHKLVQAHVLNQFCPGSIPVTCGVRRYLSGIPVEEWAAALRQAVSEQRVLKQALGYGAAPAAGGDAEQAIRSIVGGNGCAIAGLTDEEWVVQEKIPIYQEYRVHSLEDSVIEDLTFSRHSGRPVKGQRGGVNKYVQSLLDRLPGACIANLVCGWDIADTGEEGFRVIEMNIGGFHPVFQSSYQVSGFFQDRHWGPTVVARLIRFVEAKYRVRVQFIYGGSDPYNLQGWYRSLEQWSELFRISGRISRLLTEVGGAPGERRQTEGGDAHVHSTLVRVLARLKESADLID